MATWVPRGDGVKWAEEDIVTTTGIRISARGAGQSLRGLRQRAARPDLVIVDDLENDQDVENAESREKLLRWVKRAVLNLGKNCQFLFIGNHPAPRFAAGESARSKEIQALRKALLRGSR